MEYEYARERYVCNECKSVLKEPVQDCCGHRLCKTCSINLIDKKLRCPECNKFLTKDSFFPDRAAIREMDKHVVICGNDQCDWNGFISNIEEHEDKCRFKPIKCGECNVTLPKTEIKSHRYRCLKLHTYSDICYYKQQNGIQEVNQLPVCQPFVCPQGDGIRELFFGMLEEAPRRIFNECHDRMVTLLKSRMEQIRLDPTTGQAGSQFSLVQDTPENGIFKWKIPNFTSRKHEAYGGQHTPVYSSPFYISSTARYKVRVCLYVNGYGDGKNSHMSLYIVLMEGEYDDNLQWPVSIKVSFRLLNMESDCDVFVKFDPDPLRRPLNDQVKAGYSRFVPQDYVDRECVLDDNIFMECKVEMKASS